MYGRLLQTASLSPFQWSPSSKVQSKNLSFWWSLPLHSSTEFQMHGDLVTAILVLKGRIWHLRTLLSSWVFFVWLPLSAIPTILAMLYTSLSCLLSECVTHFLTPWLRVLLPQTLVGLLFYFLIIDEINCELMNNYLETCLRVSVLSITNHGAMNSLHYPCHYTLLNYIAAAFAPSKCADNETSLWQL